MGIDWAISPHAKNLPENVSLKKADIMEIDLPETDLLCSADVLEHFDTNQLETLLPKLVKKVSLISILLLVMMTATATYQFSTQMFGYQNSFSNQKTSI